MCSLVFVIQSLPTLRLRRKEHRCTGPAITWHANAFLSFPLCVVKNSNDHNAAYTILCLLFSNSKWDGSLGPQFHEMYVVYRAWSACTSEHNHVLLELVIHCISAQDIKSKLQELNAHYTTSRHVLMCLYIWALFGQKKSWNVDVLKIMNGRKIISLFKHLKG